jgi:putative ABC transport system permease protein
MIKTLIQIWESLVMALQALQSNLLRTVLSLLGVTVGIFAIISVYTLVDSLEDNVRKSMSFLGDNVIYVQKYPWIFEDDYPWWKFLNRPRPSFADFKFLERNLQTNSAIAIFASRGNRSVKYQSSTIEGIAVHGVSFEYDKVSDVGIESGRYFTQTEIDNASAFCILGYNLKDGLFENAEPLGKIVTIKGRRFTVIGTMAKQGSNMLGTPSNDNLVMIPFTMFASMYNTKRMGEAEPMIAIKGFEKDKGLVELEGELRGLLRAKRNLKPRDLDNFAINRPEMIAKQIGQIFSTIKFAGTFIGLFAILVGGFGIANIMFVSVKERTNLIGIQKSLGAKNYFILCQFLFEAVFLSIIGGLAGLLLVFGLTMIPQDVMEVHLSSSNIMVGLVISTVIGLISGIAPAGVAARMNPVDAIRSK